MFFQLAGQTKRVTFCVTVLFDVRGLKMYLVFGDSGF